MRSTRSLLALVCLIGVGLVILTAWLILADGDRPGNSTDPSPTTMPPVAQAAPDGRAMIEVEPAGNRAVRETVADPIVALENRTKAARSLISGRVETQYGEPLGGVLVELAEGFGLMGRRGGGRRSGTPARTTQTRTDGLFSFDVSPATWGTLTARGEGYVPTTLRGVGAGDEVICVLEEGERLAGIVVDEETRYPIADAIVAAGRGRRGGSSAPTVRTGGDGRFELDNLQAGTTSVQVVALGYEAGEFRDLAVSGTAAQPVTLSLQPGHYLSGVVRDQETERPIPGAAVTYTLQAGMAGMMSRFGGRGGGRGGMFGRGGFGRGPAPPADSESAIIETVVTDSAGSFTFGRVGLGGASLRAQAEGYAAGSLWGRDLEDGLDPDSDAAIVEINLVPAVTLTGRVLDPDGRPLAEARVSQGWSGSEPVSTDANGKFTIVDLAPSDRVRLTASHPRFASATTDSFAAREAPDPLEIKLLPPARIIGVVIGPDRKPEAGARVQLRRAFDRNMMRGGMNLSGMVQTTATGEDGRFLFSGLAAGRWTLAARSQISVGDPQEIELAAGEQRELTVSVIAASALTGMVVDRAGSPVAGARVYATEQTGDGTADFMARILSGDMFGGGRGDFMRGGGRPGSSAGNRGGRQDSGNGGAGRQQPAGNTSSPDTRSGDPRSSRGGMRGRGGFGRMGAFLDTRRTTAFTDDQGRFVVSGFPPDIAVLVTASRSGYAMGRAEAPAGSTGVVVTLQDLLSLEGRVADAKSGLPISSFSIEIEQQDPPQADGTDQNRTRRTRRSQRVSNPDGLFVMNRLVEGAYRIRARSSEYYPGEWITIEVLPQAPSGPRVVLRLKPAAVVTGKVLDERSRPAARMPVYLQPIVEEEGAAAPGEGDAKDNPQPAQGDPRAGRPPRARVLHEQTARDGVFSFRNLEPGDYTLGVGRSSSPSAGPVSIHLEEGQVISETLRLPPLATLEVRVKDAEGKPAQRTMVRARLEGDDRADFTGRTDEDGLARIENLLGGTYLLRATARGGRSQEVKVSVSGSGVISRQLVLEPRQSQGGGGRGPGGRGGRGG